MDIRDLMDLGDFVSSAAAPHFTTLEISTEGLLISAWSAHPITPRTVAERFRLTRQQVHDEPLHKVKAIVLSVWTKIDARLAPPPPVPAVSKPICTECGGTGIDIYDPPSCTVSEKPSHDRETRRQGSCLMCDGRGWVAQAS